MAEAGQEGLVQSSLWRIHALLFRENQVQKYLTPEPCIICLGCAEAIPGDFQVLSPCSRLKLMSCSPSQSHIGTKQCPHHHESRHQLLLLASSSVCFPAMLVPIKATPCLQSPTESAFSSSGPVLQYLLADLALPTNTPHHQVQARDT